MAVFRGVYRGARQRPGVYSGSSGSAIYRQPRIRILTRPVSGGRGTFEKFPLVSPAGDTVFFAAVSGPQAGTTSLAGLNYPAGILAGDLLVLWVDYEGPASNVATAPAEFGAKVLAANNGTSLYKDLWVKVADGTETGAVGTVDIPGGTNALGTVIDYRSYAGSVVVGGVSSGNDTSSDTTYSATTGELTTINNQLIVYCASMNNTTTRGSRTLTQAGATLGPITAYFGAGTGMTQECGERRVEVGATAPVVNTYTLGTASIGITGVLLLSPGTVALTAVVDPADETGTAQAVVAVKSGTLTQATHTDTAGIVFPRKTRIIGQATETGTVVGFAELKAKATGQAAETATADTLGEAKRNTVAQITDTNTATALGKTKLKAFVQAAEADISQTLTEVKTGTLQQAAETDTARDIIRPGQVAKAVGIDLAQPFTERKTRNVNPAVGVETAAAVTARRTLAVAQTSEVNTAGLFGSIKQKPLGQAAETNTGAATAPLKLQPIGQASETSLARPITGGGQVLIVERATESDTAYVIVPRRTTPRPYTGITTRPASGTTPRPFTGVTARP